MDSKGAARALQALKCAFSASRCSCRVMRLLVLPCRQILACFAAFGAGSDVCFSIARADRRFHFFRAHLSNTTKHVARGTYMYSTPGVGPLFSSLLSFPLSKTPAAAEANQSKPAKRQKSRTQQNMLEVDHNCRVYYKFIRR